jgi:hypothetical protein
MAIRGERFGICTRARTRLPDYSRQRQITPAMTLEGLLKMDRSRRQPGGNALA